MGTRWLRWGWLAVAGCGEAPLPVRIEPEIVVEPTPPPTPLPTQPAAVLPAGERSVFDDYDCPLDAPFVERLDVNGDGAADIFKVREAGRLVCTAWSFDGDGAIEQIELYDDEGRKRLVLRDLDGDGRFDNAEKYREGTCVARDRDLDGDGVPDHHDDCR